MTQSMAMGGNMNMNMGQQGDAGSMEQPMSHHMVVFGHESVFMSHLAMFSVPEHAYQVILEAELTGAGSDPQQIFQQDWAEHPKVAFYTFAPEPFVLSDLLPTADQPPKATTFSGDLWRNHLEQKKTHPVEIASGVTVNVKNIVCGRRFDVSAPPLSQLEYILFGRGQEVFLAHLITRPPDFDQLIQVTVTPAFSDDDLSRGHIVTVDGRGNTEDQRIQPSGQASVAATVDTGTTSISVQIDPSTEFYFNNDSDMQA
jgi:hypothetical protein